MKRLLTLLLLLPLCSSAQTILINAKAYTLDPKRPWADAIIIKDDRIAYVGTRQKALRYKTQDSLLVDLNGSFVMPGIIDAHTHVAIASVLLSEGVDLIGSKGKQDAFERIRRYAQTHPEASVITGFGFYPYMFGQNGPTALQLDAIVSDRPAFLISNNGHSAWANTMALRKLGISKETPDPQSGIHRYARDPEGNPTGFLVEGCAVWPHAAAMGIGSETAYYRSLKQTLPLLSAQGITTVFDAGAPSSQTHAFDALIRLERANALPIRYFGSHYVLSRNDAKNAANAFITYRKRYRTPLVNISSVKFVNDNSDDDHFAIQFDATEFTPFIENLMRHDIDAMIHTSADQSVHETLNAIEAARKRYPAAKSRFTLAHVNMVRDTDIERFQKYKIIANIQPFNAQGGGYYDYRYMLYGDEWENKLVRFKTFFDHDVVVSGSSDFPACDTNLSQCSPFHHMETGITRQKPGSPIDAPVLPSHNERLSVEQMIKAYTINAAYQLHQEHRIGSLQTGKKADIVVLSKNPFEIPSKEIHTIDVQMTFMNGKLIYQRGKTP